MEKNEWIFGLCIVISFFLGFVFGFSLGIGKGVEECDKWRDMYDKHITGQWKMIQRKDSMYAEYFKLIIEYMDGHVLEPEK